MTSLYIAIYGALVSTILAALQVYKFIAEQRSVTIEKRLSFESSCAHYAFVVTNVGSRNATIIDCMTMNISKRRTGRKEPDWGVEPVVLSSLVHPSSSRPLNLPEVLAPGAALILEVTSNELTTRYADYRQMDAGLTPKDGWVPTSEMVLEVHLSHERSPRKVRFRLENDEITSI